MLIPSGLCILTVEHGQHSPTRMNSTGGNLLCIIVYCASSLEIGKTQVNGEHDNGKFGSGLGLGGLATHTDRQTIFITRRYSQN